jgi:hypothetical protein
VGDVLEQAIGDVDTTGDAQAGRLLGHAQGWVWPQLGDGPRIPWRHTLAQKAQSGRSITQRPGDGDNIPRPRAGAEQEERPAPASLCLAQKRYRQGDLGGAHYVSSNDGHAKMGGAIAEAAVQGIDAGDGRAGRQGEGYESEEGPGAHGGDVAHVDRKRLPTEVCPGERCRQEVDALHQGVSGGHKVGGASAPNGGIVANADDEFGWRRLA